MKPTKKTDSELLEMLKWFVPILVYCALVRIFIGDRPDSKILDTVVGIPVLFSLACLFVLWPPVVLYSILRNSPLPIAHPWTRGPLLLASCLAPITAMFVATLPETAHAIQESHPVFAGFWLLGTFAAAAFLSFLAVSKVIRPGLPSTVQPHHGCVAESPKVESNAQNAALPKNQMKLSEIVALLAGISTIVGLIYTVVRDLARHLGQ